MPKLIGKVGEFLEQYALRNFHRVCNGFLKVFTFESGSKTWEIMDRGHAVIVLPVDYARKVVYLIEQPRLNLSLVHHPETAELFRLALEYGDACGEARVPARLVHMIDVAAGGIDKKDGNDPLQARLNAARRELREEMGFVISEDALELVSDHFVSVGGTTERYFCYLADVTGNPPREQPQGDGSESIEVYEYTFDEARALLRDGRANAGSIAVMLRELFLREAEQKLLDVERARREEMDRNCDLE